MAALRSGRLLAVIVTGVLAAGCGSNDSSGKARPGPAPAPPSGGPKGPNARSGPRSIPSPAPTGMPPDPTAVKVIRAWANALRRGDVSSAARYFALPSQFINGPDSRGQVPVFEMRTLGQVELVNASLPCGAEFISADKRGRYVNALFRLTDRPGPGGGCGSGAGQSARTNFIIVGKRIVQWIRAPDDPRDHRRGAPQAPPGPSAQPSPNPVV
jgi:hypothetical protein